MVTPNIELYRFKKSEAELPMFLSQIQCGFPSPADDFLEDVISLDDVCIQHPASTFLGRVKGSSLKDISIYEGDIVIIDKSLTPQHSDLVVCAIDGEFNAKILIIDKVTGKVSLESANPTFEPIYIAEYTDFRIWGVITYTIQNTKKRANQYWMK